MMTPMINVVAGPCGAGKTTWILEELAQLETPAAYISLGAGAVPIDATRIGLEFPRVEIIEQPSESGLAQRLVAGVAIYMEVGFQLEANFPFLQTYPHRHISVVAEDQEEGWRSPGDVMVPGNRSTLALASTRLWRSPLSGQVFDPPSADMFWQELVQGAYGEVHRVKGILEMADGRAFHMEFVKGLPDSIYTELKVPRSLDGRPDRFSGLEVVGQGLDEGAIAATLEACCLSDSTLLAHQASLANSYSPVTP